MNTGKNFEIPVIPNLIFEKIPVKNILVSQGLDSLICLPYRPKLCRAKFSSGEIFVTKREIRHYIGSGYEDVVKNCKST